MSSTYTVMAVRILLYYKNSLFSHFRNEECASHLIGIFVAGTNTAYSNLITFNNTQ